MSAQGILLAFQTVYAELAKLELDEYEEIIGRLTSPDIARNVVDAILKRKNVLRIGPHSHWNLIDSDPDDNKFLSRNPFLLHLTFHVRQKDLILKPLLDVSQRALGEQRTHSYGRRYSFRWIPNGSTSFARRKSKLCR